MNVLLNQVQLSWPFLCKERSNVVYVSFRSGQGFDSVTQRVSVGDKKERNARSFASISDEFVVGSNDEFVMGSKVKSESGL